jgi:hypothetical protein
MTFHEPIAHRHEVAPARLQAPGAVTHKDRTLMSNHHGTDDTTGTTPAEHAFWSGLGQLTSEHDTGDLSMAAKLVHDAVSRTATAKLREPAAGRDDSQMLDVSAFRYAAAYEPSGPEKAAAEASTGLITPREDITRRIEHVERALRPELDRLEQMERLDRLEDKLDAILARIGTGLNAETLSETVDRLEDNVVGAAIASTRRDRLVLEAVEGPTGREPIVTPPHPHLHDDVFALDMDDALGHEVEASAAELLHRGGVLPVTLNPDGTRRA